jgi:DNA-binding transcriptional MerR regulator
MQTLDDTKEPKLIMGIKGVAKFLKVSTTRAHVYMTGKQKILPEPFHTNSGKCHEYRCYTEEQLTPVKYLLSLAGKLEVIKAALSYYHELGETKAALNEAQATIATLKEELAKSKIVAAKVKSELNDEFEEIEEIEDPLEMVKRQETEEKEKGEVGEVLQNTAPTLTLNNP